MNLSTWKNPRQIQRVNSNIYALPIIVRNSANEISAVTHVDMFTHMHPLSHPTGCYLPVSRKI